MTTSTFLVFYLLYPLGAQQNASNISVSVTQVPNLSVCERVGTEMKRRIDEKTRQTAIPAAGYFCFEEPVWPPAPACPAPKPVPVICTKSTFVIPTLPSKGRGAKK